MLLHHAELLLLFADEGLVVLEGEAAYVFLATGVGPDVFGDVYAGGDDQDDEDGEKYVH